MRDRSLSGRRLLVVEDEYLVATALADDLSDAGAEVLGPAPSVAQALELIDGPAALDIGVLDINLAGEPVYPVADALAARGIPFVLVTGYDGHAIPDRYRDAPRLEKPVEARAVLAVLRRLLP